MKTATAVAQLGMADRFRVLGLPVFFQTRPKTRVIGFIFGQAYRVVVAQNILYLGVRDERKAQSSRMV